MSIHPEYYRTRRRIYTAGSIAVAAGLVGAMFPFIPGFLFVLVGLSILSMHSRTAHGWLATLRAKYPDLSTPLEHLETKLSRFLNLTTHTHEYLDIPARNGRTVSGLVEASRLEAGVAIVLHSASGVKETPLMGVLAEALRARGATVVRFDAREGLGEGTGAFAGFHASDYLEDLEDVLAWARTQVWWNGPLILAGHSIGALVAGTYAARHPEEVRELLFFSPTISGDSYVQAFSACDPEGLEAWKRDGIRTVRHPQTGEEYGLGYGFVEDACSYDLLRDALKLTMPVHIYTSPADTVAPVADCERFVLALEGRGTLTLVDNLPHTPIHHSELKMLRNVLMRG